MGSAIISLQFGFKIFFGTSIKITGRSKANAYSNEIPDQSEIIHLELFNESNGITPVSKTKLGFFSNFFFIESINSVESLNVLRCGLTRTLKSAFNNMSISSIPHFSRRLSSPYDGAIIIKSLVLKYVV